MRKKDPPVLAAFILLFSGCILFAFYAASAHPAATPGAEGMALTLKSSAFEEGADIPKAYTCQGDDKSPGLTWSNAPSGTKSFALIADDPDAPAGTWTHWTIWNIPATTTSLREDVEKVEQLTDGSRQGTSDFRRVAYGGPCPPAGKGHRYYFKLYALNGMLEVRAGASRKELEDAMRGHILAQAQIMGRYQRQ